MPQKRLRVYGGDVDAAQGDGSALNIPEAGSQLAGCGFTAAGGAHQSRHLALPCGEGHILQNALMRPIGEFHMVEDNIIVLRLTDLCAGLHRLLLDGAHPFNLQLGTEGGGDVLEH